MSLAGLYISIKVISGSCDDAVKQLIRCVNTHKCIGVLVSGCGDSHKEVRTQCGIYLAQLISQYNVTYGSSTDNESINKLSAFDSQLDVICDTVCKYIGDGDKDVRSSHRQIFDALYCNERTRTYADRMFNTFSAAIQRTIEAERRTNSKKKLNKRKKNISTSSIQ